MNAAPIVRLLRPGDAAVLSDVAEDVFDNEINPRWTAEFLSDPRHHMVCLLAHANSAARKRGWAPKNPTPPLADSTPRWAASKRPWCTSPSNSISIRTPSRQWNRSLSSVSK